jgi:transglutaminase-like putative cysteine protease
VKLHIHHRTCYRYAQPVAFGPHELLVRPRESHSVRIESFALKVEPAHHLRWMRDLHENNLGLLDVTEPASQLLIELECSVELAEHNPFDFLITRTAEEYPFVYDHELLAELSALCVVLNRRDTERLAAWLHPLWHPGRRVRTLDLLQQINLKIYEDIRYQRRERKGVQSPAETLDSRSGSCRDFAALFMETCRFLGLATRFVSGYMYHAGITGRMSMHGWAEVYLPGAGWIGFDPSWGILADCHYVPVAVTRNPEHAPPVSGSFYGYARDFIRTDVDLYVRRLDEPASAPAEHEALKPQLAQILSADSEGGASVSREPTQGQVQRSDERQGATA